MLQKPEQTQFGSNPRHRARFRATDTQAAKRADRAGPRGLSRLPPRFSASLILSHYLNVAREAQELQVSHQAILLCDMLKYDPFDAQWIACRELKALLVSGARRIDRAETRFGLASTSLGWPC
jgi:hypothetical protein